MEPALHTEDDILAGIIATAVGAINTDKDQQHAVATYLLHLMPEEIHAEPQAAAEIAREVADTILDQLPTPEGVAPLTDLTSVDLAFSKGPLGLGGFAREMVMRARYAANAARRLARAYLTGGPDQREAARAKEKAYFNAHRRAQAQREPKMAAIDEAVKRYGNELGWYSVLDNSTTPECRDAHGKNFSVTNPPPIGLPGVGPHPNCRCHAGPPFPNGDSI